MSNAELVTIGAFARASGLTPSALRFYADSGLLAPAEVDSVTGYRYYAREQVDRAVTIRLLREIGMPLEEIATALAAAPEDAAVRIDRHVDALAERVHRARTTAARVRAGLGRDPRREVTAVPGPVLAAAVDQVLTATAHDPELPVLGGVRVEASEEALVLTATDRYRLSTRTVPLTEPCRVAWAGTVDGDDLRLALPWLRRRSPLRLGADTHGLHLTGPDGDTRVCRLLPDPFPDHRAMLDGLDPVVTRVLLPRTAVLRAVEQQPGHRVRLRVSEAAVTVSTAGADESARIVPARVDGPAMTLDFEVTTLHPALVTAVGADVLLDLAGTDRPALVRSADDGDLTTVAMPTLPDREGPDL